MRKRIVAGNWKMNKTPQEAKALIETLKAAGWPGRKCRGGILPAVCFFNYRGRSR